jgi:hypothetical protein
VFQAARRDKKEVEGKNTIAQRKNNSKRKLERSGQISRAGLFKAHSLPATQR